jgi:hypothetical protein
MLHIFANFGKRFYHRFAFATHIQLNRVKLASTDGWLCGANKSVLILFFAGKLN